MSNAKSYSAFQAEPVRSVEKEQAAFLTSCTTAVHHQSSNLQPPTSNIQHPTFDFRTSRITRHRFPQQATSTRTAPRTAVSVQEASLFLLLDLDPAPSPPLPRQYRPTALRRPPSPPTNPFDDNTPFCAARLPAGHRTSLRFIPTQLGKRLESS